MVHGYVNISVSSDLGKVFFFLAVHSELILLTRATHVPVGEDQKQHIEFARECATNFNTTYNKSVLVPPEIILCKSLPPSFETILCD